MIFDPKLKVRLQIVEGKIENWMDNGLTSGEVGAMILPYVISHCIAPQTLLALKLNILIPG
jgi:hypothetical protein